MWLLHGEVAGTGCSCLDWCADMPETTTFRVQCSSTGPQKMFIPPRPPPPTPCNGCGLQFEAFYWNSKTLTANGSPISIEHTGVLSWTGLQLIVTHKVFKQKVWYSTDSDFKQIDGLNGIGSYNNRIMVRWSGNINAPTTGQYCFKIRSDDGSQIWWVR